MILVFLFCAISGFLISIPVRRVLISTGII